ncbi:MAG: hypothetical protein L0211_12990 [Planctomycetaceae bacterium]|nr:hypothetical protein [Planctomycetaceae bacterium]
MMTVSQTMGGLAGLGPDNRTSIVPGGGTYGGKLPYQPGGRGKSRKPALNIIGGSFGGNGGYE